MYLSLGESAAYHENQKPYPGGSLFYKTEQKCKTLGGYLVS
jgi:hypothetical protein